MPLLLVAAVLFLAWPLVIPPIVGLVIIYKVSKDHVNRQTKLNDIQSKLEEEKESIEKEKARFNEERFIALKSQIVQCEETINCENLKVNQLTQLFASLCRYIENINKPEITISELDNIRKCSEALGENHYDQLVEIITKYDTQIKKKIIQIEKLSFVFNAIKNFISRFKEDDAYTDRSLRAIEENIESLEIENVLKPTVEVNLHSKDLKDLRKQYKEICKNIDSVLSEFENRYTSKSFVAIYRLMVLALRAELQNVMTTMKYGRLEDSELAIKTICNKYIKIAADGNQTIAPTVTKFITQIESLFIDAVKTEYEYYVRKERAKEEQRAIREQMRQEAEERKRLEEERKKIEAEESKYAKEMEKLQSQLDSSDVAKSQVLSDRIAELEALLAQVSEKKDIIAKLQNGKAGYVYVISNLGSFGDHVFKIGMTRRREPQDRIDELGSASVPFAFDVHCMIFSEDAPALETAIHNRLHQNRVNKVNLRKEFFDISIDELEALVNELEPSAEFTRTMLAEQYRQSLSMSSILDTVDIEQDEDDE